MRVEGINREDYHHVRRCLMQHFFEIGRDVSRDFKAMNSLDFLRGQIDSPDIGVAKPDEFGMRLILRQDGIVIEAKPASQADDSIAPAARRRSCF